MTRLTGKLRLPLLVACLVIIGAAGASPQDIVNPIEAYIEVTADDGTTDSVLTTTITYDPLPAYGKQTRLRVEHQALFATDSGMLVEIRGEAVENVALDMPEYARVVPGPIQQGDTLTVDFYLTPRQVGIIPLELIIYDNVELVPDKAVRVGCMSDISFILGADGKTFGVASSAVSRRRSTVLGPGPEFLDRERIFKVNPRYPQPDLQWLNLAEERQGKSKEDIFELDVRISPLADRPNLLSVIGRVVPYHNFPYGIALQVSHSNDLLVTEVDPCVVGPVWRDSVYEFSFVTELLSPGVASLFVNFITPNAHYGREEGVYSTSPNVLSTELALKIGIDKQLRPLFMTEVALKPYLRAVKNAGVDPQTIDERFSFVEANLKDEFELTTLEAGYFGHVMKYLKR